MFAGERCPVNDNFVLAGGCCHKKTVYCISLARMTGASEAGNGRSDGRWQAADDDNWLAGAAAEGREM